MSRKKKNRRLLLIMLAVLAVCILALLLSKKLREDDGEGEADDDEYVEYQVLSIDTDSCVAISFTYESSELRFVRDDEAGWVMDGEPEFPLEASAVDNLVATVADITSEYVIEGVTDPESFGLEDPVVCITVECANGDVHEIRVGDAYPLGSDRYVITDAEPDKVYVGSNALYTYFSAEKSSFISEPALPGFGSTDIRQITFLVDGYDAYNLRYEENNSLDVSGLYPWILTPLDGEEYVADGDKLDDLLIAAASVSFESVVDYRTDKLPEYGITDDSDMIVIEYFEDAEDIQDMRSMTLLLGEHHDDEHVYVNVAGTGYVYSWPVSSLEKLTIEDLRDYMVDYFGMLQIRTVSVMEIVTPESDITYGIRYDTVTDEEGNSSEVLNVTRNGEAVADDQKYLVLALYSDIISLHDVGPDPSGAEPGASILKVVYTTTLESFPTYTVEYFEYDRSYYLVIVNGERKAFADKREVDAVLLELD